VATDPQVLSVDHMLAIPVQDRERDRHRLVPDVQGLGKNWDLQTLDDGQLRLDLSRHPET
jgi:hypothetical protein